jgi:hypothetical protein
MDVFPQLDHDISNVNCLREVESRPRYRMIEVVARTGSDALAAVDYAVFFLRARTMGENARSVTIPSKST